MNTHKTIEQAMKDEEVIGIRLSVAGKWMVWDETWNAWIVYEHKHGQRGVSSVAHENLSDALAELTK